MHVLPQLRKLERRYPNELQVVSVHSPKFPAEREIENLRRAVLRLRIEHPVVNDAEFLVWSLYSATAWPTMIFIDPNGDVIARHAGEIDAEALVPLVEHWLAQYREDDLLASTPLDLAREQPTTSDLSFPGKVAYDDASGRLFVADSSRDRILVARLDGTVEQVVGGSDIGASDGPPQTATFNQPQGLAFVPEGAAGALYVADLENHLIRRIDLTSWETTTVAGTGQQLRQHPQRGSARESALNSPWDLAHRDGTLYIAMAGMHQLWALDLATAEIGPWAGTTAEGLVDGPRDRAELAQPSGLALGTDTLTFADSESSAVRSAGLGPGGRVDTILGTGLFDFGDRDGDADGARLQHPLDVAWLDDELYVADSFNHKIKRVFPFTRAVDTLCGSEGYAGGTLAEARFREPGGLCRGPGRSLIVADTSNHAIRQIDLAGGVVRTISLQLPSS